MSLQNRFFTTSILILSALFLLIASLPSILSTSWVKDRLLNSVSSEINGSVQAENITLSWFGPQKVEGVRLLGPHGEEVATLYSLTTDTSLFAFMSSNPTLKGTRIQMLNAELGDPLVKTLGAKYFPYHVKGSDSVSLTDTNLTFDGSSESFTFQASGQTLHKKKKGAFNFDFVVSEEGSRLKGNIDQFPVEILDVLAALNTPSAYGVMTQLIGETLNLKINEASQGETSHFTINLRSDRMKMDLEGQLTDDALVISSPSPADFSMNPSAFTEVMSLAEQKNAIHLLKPIQLKFNLREIKIPLAFFQGTLNQKSARNLTMDVSISLPELAWQAQGEKSAMKDFRFAINAPQGHSSINLSLNGRFQQDGKNFPFDLKSLHRKPVNVQDLVVTMVQPQEMTFSLDDLKTKSLDSFFGTGNNWQKTFGNTLSLRMKSHDNDLQALEASLKSDKIVIPKLEVTLDQELTIGNTNKRLSGKVYAKEIAFTTQKSMLENFTINWEVDPSKQNLQAKFSGQTVFSGSQVDGHIDGSVFVDLNQGDNPVLRTDLKGSHVPAPFLSLVTGRKEWEPVFGSVIDLHVKTHMKDLSGPIKAEIFGSNGKLQVDGQLTQGVLTLNSPLHLSTKASKELGKDVLSDFAPVFGELVSAESSISLDIDPDQFSMPISMNYSQMNFKRAVLDLGKMTFRNGGDVRRLLNVLKADNPQEVEVWATPMYLSMDKGMLTVYRMDMLVMERYPIATWGKIHFANDKVNMVLGLSPVALAQSLGISGLPKDYMLQIPIKGSTSNTKIDSAKVMSRIGALLAQSSGGPEGLVLGTVLDIANGKEPKIPPPTTNPLPWGNMTVKTNQDENSSSSTSNPVNDIRKEASKLIKGIFR